MKTCTQCDREYEDDKKYCLDCGSALEDGAVPDPICATCGTANQAGFKFCKKCGSAIGEAAKLAVVTPAPDPAQPKGKQVEPEKKIGLSPIVKGADPISGLPTERVVAHESAVIIEPPRPEKTEPAVLATATTQPAPETPVVNQKVKVTAQPKVEMQIGAVTRPSTSWRWLVAAGVVVLITSGIGYLFISGLIGKNPANVQMKLDAELKAQGLDNLSIAIGKDWVATVSGFVESEADRGRVLGIVESNNDVREVEDRITVATTKGGPTKAATAPPSAQPPSMWTGEDSSAKTETAPPSTQQPPSMRNLEEALKQGTFE